MIVKRGTISPIQFEGLRIFDYTADLRTGSSIAVIEVPPCGRHRRAYSKRSDKYYYVVSGSVKFIVENSEYELAAGDFCYVAAEREFEYSNDRPVSARLLLVHTPSFDIDSEVFVQR